MQITQKTNARGRGFYGLLIMGIFFYLELREYGGETGSVTFDTTHTATPSEILPSNLSLEHIDFLLTEMKQIGDECLAWRIQRV